MKAKQIEVDREYKRRYKQRHREAIAARERQRNELKRANPFADRNREREQIRNSRIENEKAKREQLKREIEQIKGLS